MRLPHNPLTVEQHKTRYAQALVKTYHSEDCERGAPTPGQCADNLFDFDDGLRLIISKDVLEDSPKPILHVSASVLPRSLLYNDLESGKITPAVFVGIAAFRFGLIAGKNGSNLWDTAGSRACPIGEENCDHIRQGL